MEIEAFIVVAEDPFRDIIEVKLRIFVIK